MTQEQMLARLQQKFPDSRVAVLDLTGTSDHYEIQIQSPFLSRLDRVGQHKEVMGVFAEELKTGEVHALTIKVLPVE